MAPDTCDALDSACFLAEVGFGPCRLRCAASAAEQRGALFWRLDEPKWITGPAHLSN